ncbi:MAG TPA: alpha/beta hydrolase [Trichormus sp.]
MARRDAAAEAARDGNFLKMLHVFVLIAIVGLLALYVVLCPRLNYTLYRPLLFHPVSLVGSDINDVPEIAGVKGESVKFKNPDGDMLYGWYFNKPGATYTVLLSHGNGGNVTYRQDTIGVLLNTGASVLIYDYRGYGNSEGLPTVAGICDDAVAAYDYLTKDRGVAPNHTILYGESLGCAVTTNLSTRRKCAGIIIQSGFASLNQIATEMFPVLAIYPGRLLADPPLDNLSILKEQHAPLLIVHGQQDEVVPFSHASAVFRAASEPKQFLQLPTCGHCDISVLAVPEFSHALTEFFATLAPATAHSITGQQAGTGLSRHS